MRNPSSGIIYMNKKCVHTKQENTIWNKKMHVKIAIHGNGIKPFNKISEWHKNLQSPIHTIQYAILMDQNMGNGGDKMHKLQL